MSNNGTRSLWRVLDFRLSELLGIDLYIGLLGGTGALIVSFVNPEAILRTVPIAASIVGVILGAVVAGITVQTAFMDQAFLRKVRAIDRDPTRYLAPFIFTATIGVFAMLGLVVLGAFSPTAPRVALVAVSTLTSLLAIWTVASLLPGLATLVQFIGLKVDALDIPDDINAGTKARSTK